MIRLERLIQSIEERDFLATYKVERDARIKVKLLALYHLQNGKSIQEVSDIVQYDRRRVRDWSQMFVLFDYEGLIERKGRGRKPRLSQTEEEVFRDQLDDLQESRQGRRVTVYDTRELLADEFNCCYSRSGVYALLDRLNIVWISGRSKHPKHSQEAIDQFKELFPDEIEGIKDKIESDKIGVWWQDKSRIGQQGSLSRVWATKGTRPRVSGAPTGIARGTLSILIFRASLDALRAKTAFTHGHARGSLQAFRQRQFLSTYIFGAVCPDRDVGCALILPQCNSGMTQIHLDQISEHVKKGHHAILLIDRAGLHTTEALNVPKNITLLPLPPYSPELNPMEQVWQQLRKIKLSNTNFKDYDHIVDSCCEAWNCFCDEDGNIQNLCARDWAVI